MKYERNRHSSDSDDMRRSYRRRDSSSDSGRNDSPESRRFRSRSSEDLPDEDMLNNPDGLNEEPAMHFDFDDDDVRYYRRQSQEKAARRDARSQERRRAEKAGAGNTKRRSRRRPELDEDAIGGEETVMYGIRNKQHTNKEIMRVTTVMLVIFFAMIGYFLYFKTAQSKTAVYNQHNSRLAKLSENVVRGSIYSADGQVLAQTLQDADGNYYRNYPYGNVFSHVVGTSDVNISGIELSSDLDLISTTDDTLTKLKNQFTGEKSPGNNVVTTLNTALQQTASDAMGSYEGAVVAIEPSTGKVLAMVSKPDYDPNSLPSTYEAIKADTENSVLFNNATDGVFVPGSIFKTITTLSYLRSQGSLDGFSYYCSGSILLDSDNGEQQYLHCAGGERHGQQDYADAFAYSCNSAFAQIGLDTGTDQLTETANSMLFNQDLGTSFHTAVSNFDLTSEDTDWQIGATAIGQGRTTITPIHAAMIASTIANDGVLNEPYVVSEVTDPEGNVLSTAASDGTKELMTADEAETLTQLMEGVTDYGTAESMGYHSYTIAGKTGTAEISDNEADGYNAWFIGFAPADNPQIAICVLVENASSYASKYAVPIADEIFTAYLGE